MNNSNHNRVNYNNNDIFSQDNVLGGKDSNQKNNIRESDSKLRKNTNGNYFESLKRKGNKISFGSWDIAINSFPTVGELGTRLFIWTDENNNLKSTQCFKSSEQGVDRIIDEDGDYWYSVPKFFNFVFSTGKIEYEKKRELEKGLGDLLQYYFNEIDVDIPLVSNTPSTAGNNTFNENDETFSDVSIEDFEPTNFSNYEDNNILKDDKMDEDKNISEDKMDEDKNISEDKMDEDKNISEDKMDEDKKTDISNNFLGVPFNSYSNDIYDEFHQNYYSLEEENDEEEPTDFTAYYHNDESVDKKVFTSIVENEEDKWIKKKLNGKRENFSFLLKNKKRSVNKACDNITEKLDKYFFENKEERFDYMWKCLTGKKKNINFLKKNFSFNDVAFLYKKPDISQQVLLLDEDNLSTKKFFNFYNSLCLNPFIHSATDLDAYISKLNSDVIEKFPLKETEDGTTVSLKPLLKFLISQHVLFNIIENNIFLIKLGIDEGTKVYDRAGKICICMNILNSILYGYQDNPIFLGAIRGKEKFEVYQKNLVNIKEEIIDIKKNGIEVFGKKFFVGFFLTTDLKTLFSLSDQKELKKYFCPYCDIEFQDRHNRWFIKFSKINNKNSRTNVDELKDNLTGIESFVICLLHMQERLTEYLLKIITLSKNKLCPYFQAVVEKVQRGFAYSFGKKNDPDLDDVDYVSCSMILGDKVIPILTAIMEALRNINEDSELCDIYHQYNEKDCALNESLITLEQQASVLNAVECMYEIFTKFNTLEIFNEEEISRVYEKLENFKDYKKKVDRTRCPCYLHILSESLLIVKNMGGIPLKLFKNEGVERINYLRRKVLESRLQRSNTGKRIRQDELLHTLRKFYIYQERMEEFIRKINFKKKYLPRIFQSISWYDDDDFNDLMNNDLKILFLVPKYRIEAFRDILDKLRKRIVQTSTSASVWRKNPCSFLKFLNKHEEIEDILEYYLKLFETYYVEETYNDDKKSDDDMDEDKDATWTPPEDDENKKLVNDRIYTFKV